MRVFHISGDQFSELDGLPESLPPTGYLWVGSARREFEVQTPMLQAALQRWTGGQLVDVHIADLLNNQLPSHFDYTSWYDMLVFRRLAAGEGSAPMFLDDSKGTLSTARAALDAIDTSPVGFALFDRVLLTVHPTDCAVPRISLMVPLSSLASDLKRMVRAMSMTCFIVMLPLCLTFLGPFLRSRSGSFRALTTSELAAGTTSTVATRLTTVSLTVILRPFHAMVAFWMSSPTFLGDCATRRRRRRGARKGERGEVRGRGV